MLFSDTSPLAARSPRHGPAGAAGPALRGRPGRRRRHAARRARRRQCRQLHGVALRQPRIRLPAERCRRRHPSRREACTRRRWCPAGRRRSPSRGRPGRSCGSWRTTPPTSTFDGIEVDAAFAQDRRLPEPRRANVTLQGRPDRQRDRREGRAGQRNQLHVRQRRLPRRSRDRPVGPQRVRLRDRRARHDRPQQPLLLVRHDGSLLHLRLLVDAAPAGLRERHAREQRLRPHLQGRRHLALLHPLRGQHGQRRGHPLRLEGAQQHLRDRRLREPHARAADPAGSATSAPGTACAGVTYRRNVGDKCAGSDKAVVPATSSAARIAPLGWLNPAPRTSACRAGSPAIDAADPGDYPATDRDGFVRDSRPDAGAHEFGAGPPGGARRRRWWQARAAPDRPLTGEEAAANSRSPPQAAGHLQAAPGLLPGGRTPHPRLSAKARVTSGSCGSVTVTSRGVRSRRLSVTGKRTTRIRAHRLARGRYRVIVVATSRGGLRSRPSRSRSACADRANRPARRDLADRGDSRSPAFPLAGAHLGSLQRQVDSIDAPPNSARGRGHELRARPAVRTPGSGSLPLVAYVVGARPNFVKMAPVIEAMRRRGHTRQLVVHTGQHYDRGSRTTSSGPRLPASRTCSLGSRVRHHADQTGKVLMAFEQVLLERRPDLVVVAGDVNSTLACALAAAKLGVPWPTSRPGLRSDDWTMPEEINRVLTDRMSDVLLTHSPEPSRNLLREGIDPARIHYVGNTMIDSLRGSRARRAARRLAGARAGGTRVRARDAAPTRRTWTTRCA